MDAQYTPGPWKVGYRALDVVTDYDDSCGFPMKICDIRGWGHLTGKGALGLSSSEAEAIQTANAHLIAAAPELLEALVAILGPLNVCSDNPNVRDDVVLPVDMTMGELRQARVAIAKARPQSGEEEEGR